MTDTDLRQPGPGPLRPVAGAAEPAQAISGLVGIFGYPVTPFGSGGTWPAAGLRGTEAG